MLIERASQLAALGAALDGTIENRGRLVFVGGDAGVGKTTLAIEAARQGSDRARVLRGVYDNVTTPAPLGALVDADAELADLVDEGERLSRPVLFRRLRQALTATPTMLVLDDVHWADEATLDLIRFLGRRLDGLALLLVATYRLDEVGARHPLAVVLGDLATEPGVSRLVVEPLSPAGVAELVAISDSELDPAELHQRTGGNPFFVTEVLAAPESGVPATVRDAVLARAARLSDGARRVLAAAAVLGQPADAGMLAATAGGDPTDVDECVELGLLVADRDGLGFRHRLARLAVEHTLPPGTVRQLHCNALAALRGRGSDDDRRLARHAAAAGERSAARGHAGRAAARAARLGAHREAVTLYRLALQCVDDDPADRADLLVALSYECYLTDDPEDALAARHKALELATLAGDALALGSHQRWISRLSWFLGRNADAERYADRAVATLEPLGDGPELGMAYSNKAQLGMLIGDLDAAVHWGERALVVARRIGDREVEMHALNNLGSAGLQLDDSIEAGVMLSHSLDLALADDAHEHAARAYTNLGSLARLNRRLADAEAHLRDGIAYSADRDLDSWTLYMRAQLAMTLCEAGRYDEALAGATDVLRHQRLSPVSAIGAAVVAGRIAARRGLDATEWLDRAWALAAATGEAQRLVPAAVARAEAAWLTGAAAPVDALDLAWAATTAHPARWEVAELSYWRGVAGLPAGTTLALPEPFALLRDRRWRDAAQVWRRLGCPLWQALALGRADELTAARESFDLLARLGAPAVRAAVARDRHAAGLQVPRGPRHTQTANRANLTTRELEVLGLLAQHRSNTDIARELFLSDRTVEHHVSAILRKLGEPTRARAVTTATRLGVLAAPT